MNRDDATSARLSRRLSISYGLLAALLFGASTPAAKWLLGEIAPQLLAGLLYLGAGIGLSFLAVGRRLFGKTGKTERLPAARELPWLAGAVLAGGVIGPVLLMRGLTQTDAATGSLLLNLEGVFTALLAWFVFHENFDRRVVLGMTAILAGGIVLSWPGNSTGAWSTRDFIGPFLVASACLAWAIDNNLTRKISSSDPIATSLVKGSVAGTINVLFAVYVQDAHLPGAGLVAGALSVGFVGYGLSLVCFVFALRHLGAARTGAYFSTAPFCGAAIAILLGQGHISLLLVVAGALMAGGLWLHLTEHHAHEHTHDSLEHEHSHVHDEHHQHIHGADIPPSEPHSHRHRHAPIVHAHEHFPDIHHQHTKDDRPAGEAAMNVEMPGPGVSAKGSENEPAGETK